MNDQHDTQVELDEDEGSQPRQMANGHRATSFPVPDDTECAEALTTAQILGNVDDARRVLVARRQAAAEELATLDTALRSLGVEAFRDVLHVPLTRAGHVDVTRAARVRKPGVVVHAAPKKAPRARKPASGTPRIRRSAADLDKGVTELVELVAKHPEGMRAEDIRAALGIERKFLPKLLQEAIKQKRLKKAGSKRATIYSSR